MSESHSGGGEAGVDSSRETNNCTDGQLTLSDFHKDCYKSKQWLDNRYWGDGMTIAEIANETDKHRSTIYYWIKKHGLKTRDNSGYKKDYEYKDPEYLKEKYHNEGLSARQIADEFDINTSVILRLMEKHGIDRRGHEEKIKGRRNWAWNEYVPCSINSTGYRSWTHTYGGETTQFPVHRLVAISEHGVDAVKGKHIHHKNGFKIDNRPENLEPVDPVTHARNR